jgi:hypothetical protein
MTTDFDFLPDNIKVISPKDKITQEYADNEDKSVRFYGKHQQAADLVVNHGVEPKDALILVTGKNPDRASLSRFREKVNKYSLARPAMQKLAHKAVRDVLEGKEVEVKTQKVTPGGKIVEYTEKLIPSHTNRLAAAAMVADRVEPIVRQNINLNINTEVAPVDLSKYLNR